MSYRYQFRVLPDGQATRPQSYAVMIGRLALKLRGRGPHTLEYEGERYHRKRTTAEVLLRLRRLVRKRGLRVIIHRSRGPRIAVRRVEAPEVVRPVNTIGTPAIDRIVGAVHAEFDSKWFVRDMGISRNCSDGSSEHCYDNAWDVGTNEGGVSAEEIHRRVTAMGRWLMEQGQLHLRTGGKEGLPVKGVIFMDRYWSRSFGQDGTRHYGGVPHVSHAHVSGHPGFLGNAYV